MDLVIRQEILKLKKLKSREKMVLATIELIFSIDREPDEPFSLEGWTSQKCISIMSGLPVMAVKCALAELCDFGLIAIMHSKYGRLDRDTRDKNYETIKSISHTDRFMVSLGG